MSSLFEFSVNDILTLVSDLKGETSVDTSTLRIRAIDRANKDFSLRRTWQLFRLPDQTTIGTGSSVYTLGSSTYPARPNGLLEVFVETTGSSNMTPESARKTVVPFEKFKSYYNSDSTADIVCQYFDVANNEWKMKINPSPESTETITFTHYWTPATVSQTTDKVYCYDPMIIARLANAYLYENEDEDKYQDQLQLAENLIQKWEQIDDETPVGELLSVESSIRGIGK